MQWGFILEILKKKVNFYIYIYFIILIPQYNIIIESSLFTILKRYNKGLYHTFYIRDNKRQTKLTGTISSGELKHLSLTCMRIECIISS